MVYFWGAVLLLIAAMGIYDIISNAKYSVKINSKNAGIFTILEFSGSDNSVEYLIKETIKKYKWCNYVKYLYIIVVDNGMDTDTLNLCEKIIDQYDYISICRKDNLAEHILERIAV